MKKILVCFVCCTFWLMLSSSFALEPPTSSLTEEEAGNRFKKALELFEKKEYTGAVKALDVLRSESLELIDYIDFFLIRAYTQSAKDAEALSLSQSFLARFPSHPLAVEVALLEASLLMKQQRFQDALKRYRGLLQEKKVSEENLLYPMGQALAALGKSGQAVDAFQTLLQFHPAHADAKAARKALGDIVASQSDLQPVWTEESLFRYAETLLAFGLHSSAATHYKKYQAHYPAGAKFGESELGLAEAWLRSRKLQEGQRLLEQMTTRYAESRPDMAAEALYTLGRRSWNADRNSEAKALMQRILTEFRTSSRGDDAWYILGRIYQSQQAYQPAAQCYRSLAAQFPGSTFAEEALFRAGWSLYLARNYAKAVQLFSQASQAFSSGDYVANGRFWMGKSLEAAGERELAAEAFRSVLTSVPGAYYAALSRNSLRRLAGTVSEPRRAPEKPPTIPDVLADLEPRLSKTLYQEIVTHARKAFALHRLELSRYARGEIEWIGDILDAQAQSPDDSEAQARTLYLQARLYGEIDEHLLAIRLAYRISNMQKAGSLKAFPYAIEYLQYPLLHKELIRKYAVERGLDPFLVAGLIRQESAYNAKVSSPAGARGLMQIMPTTGKRIARKLGLKNYSTARLFEPEINIAIGTAYLAAQLEDFDGNLFRSLAAYNAGPNATKKWWKAENAGQEEEIVENISYKETRNYVKYVLRNYDQYRQLYPELSKPRSK